MRSAIRQELDRGGQVFYVVPRVEGIEEVGGLRTGCFQACGCWWPTARWPEGDLESAMVAFNAGEADVMLCTTIVESGLDIPRVNTILIEDAQKFGLAAALPVAWPRRSQRNSGPRLAVLSRQCVPQ